jgi:cobalt-zinc-cadmium efflux system protein
MFHHHNHDHNPSDYHRAFAFGVTLNLGYVAVEATFGILAGSLALLADTGDDDEILEKAAKNFMTVSV